MKFRQLIILLGLLALSKLCLAGEALQGDAFYAKGQYKEAIASYQSVLSEGWQSAALYYNLGNAYFKAGELPSAILYYEKARLLSPGDEDINFNIRFANSKTVDKVEQAPEFFLNEWWHSIILFFAANTLALLAITLIIIGSLLLIIYFFSTNLRVKKTSFFAAIAFFVFGLFSIYVAKSQADYFKANKQGIIFASVANVKSSPTEQSKTAFVLHEGTKVNLKETNGEYTRIKLANGTEGWLKASDIRKI